MVEQLQAWTPLLSALGAWVATVATMKTEIQWLKRTIERLDGALVRAHERIDLMEKRN